MYNFISNIQICVDGLEGMISRSVLYYSHLPAIIVALFFGVFVVIKSKESLSSLYLFFIALAYSLWSVLDLITWLSSSSVNIMFFWSLMGITEGLFFIATFFFVYSYVYKKWGSFIYLFIITVSFLPLIILTPTNYNLSSFYINECTATDNYFLNYIFVFEIIITSLVFYIIIKNLITNKLKRKENLLLLSGVSILLFSFFVTGYLSDYFSIYSIESYGLFGMAIFIGFLSYLIVKFKTFNIKLIGAQALVWALVIFIGSQFLYMDKMPLSSLIITAITLVLSAVIGLMIVRGIKKEIAIREKIEKLADELEHTNDRLRELDLQKTQFVSLASHQLRAPLTAIKGYLSMILEGDYGEVKGEVREMVERVLSSSNNLVTIVGDFLDVSRIEQGKMRYEWADFDLKGLVETVYNEQQPVAEKRGLKLNLNIEEHVEYKLHGDMNKLKQVFTNLTDNSIKYTPKGEVSLSLSRPSPKVIRFEINDTGIGISKETMPKLFEKFVRADGANDVNVIGTGLGLFVAKEMIKAHEGGKIWAESEGLGKGSRFVVELKAL